MGLCYSLFKGLPFSDVGEVELNVCLNYVAIVINSTGDDRLVPGGYNVCQAAIERTLCRGKFKESFWEGEKIFMNFED